MLGEFILLKNFLYLTEYFKCDRQKFEKGVLKLIKKKKIELICLAGFMKILSKNFVRNLKVKF